jgi:Terpene cyclase DEP1
MAETTALQPTAGMPTTSKILCASYAVISIAALVATWSQNVAYFDHPARFLTAFLDDSKVTPASRSLTVDILLFALAATVLMVVEARKHGVKFVWLYILGGATIAISVTFPLFLIAREFRIAKTDSPRLGAADTIGLAVVAIVVAALTVWVDT